MFLLLSIKQIKCTFNLQIRVVNLTKLMGLDCELNYTVGLDL